MSEAELIKYVKDRMDAIEAAQVRLEDKIDRKLDSFGVRMESYLDKLESTMDAKFSSRNGKCSEHSMRLERNATTIGLLEGEVKRIKNLVKGVWLFIAPLIALAIAAIVKLFWQRR